MPQIIRPKIFCIPLQGYRHMYRSLIRYYSLSGVDAIALLYPLYIGNLDSCQYYDVRLKEIELTEDGFYSLARPYARPYHTELQMHRSMHNLLQNIRREAVIQDTKEALRRLTGMINQLEDRFETVYDCEITDSRTRYNECWNRLTVRNTEPRTIFKGNRED